LHEFKGAGLGLEYAARGRCGRMWMRTSSRRTFLNRYHDVRQVLVFIHSLPRLVAFGCRPSQVTRQCLHRSMGA
jgi:hypothetical protein